MDILNTVGLESNSQIKINSAVCLKQMIPHGSAHKDDENLMQVIYQIFAAYFEDGCTDELVLVYMCGQKSTCGISTVTAHMVPKGQLSRKKETIYFTDIGK